MNIRKTHTIDCYTLREHDRVLKPSLHSQRRKATLNNTSDSTETSRRRLFDICKTYFISVCSSAISRLQDVSYQMPNRCLSDVFKMFMIYKVCKTEICQTFVHSRCFPDQEMFNRRLAHVCVLYNTLCTSRTRLFDTEILTLLFCFSFHPVFFYTIL